MAYKLVISPRARSDLKRIWLWIAEQASPVVADTVTDGLIARARQLEMFPRSGRDAPELGHGTRALSHRPYIIMYRIADHHVEVVHIAHGAQHPDRLHP